MGSPVMARMPTLAAALVAAVLGVILFLEIQMLWHQVVGSSVVAVSATGLLLFWPVSERSDDDVCAGCTHLRVEHHGICQACQRDVVSRRPGAPTFACERFCSASPTSSTSIST